LCEYFSFGAGDVSGYKEQTHVLWRLKNICVKVEYQGYGSRSRTCEHN